MAKDVVFGIIGAGMIAGNHARSIQSLPGCRLAGFCDTRGESARKRAAEFNCRAYESLDEMLADPEIDAVTIATPSGMHMENAIAAARAKKHIFSEKPLDVTVEKADAILQACAENNCLLAPVFQLRFTKPVQLLRQAVAAGRFGKMIFASAQMHWYRSQEYFSGSNWRGTWAMDGGGALMNQAVHMIDLMLYINGAPLEVYAMSDTMTHDIEVEDTLVAAVKWANGAYGTIEVSTSCAPGFSRHMEFAGSNGSVAFEEENITRWSFTEPQAEDEEILRLYSGETDAKGAADPTKINQTGHACQIANLADAIRNGTPLLIDGAEGRRAVEFICGIYESARTGKPVRFDR